MGLAERGVCTIMDGLGMGSGSVRSVDPTEGGGGQGIRGIWLRRNFRFHLDHTLVQEWVDDMEEIKWSIYWGMCL